MKLSVGFGWVQLWKKSRINWNIHLVQAESSCCTTLISICPEGEGAIRSQENPEEFLICKRCFPIGHEMNVLALLSLSFQLPWFELQHILLLLLFCHDYLWHNYSGSENTILPLPSWLWRHFGKRKGKWHLICLNRTAHGSCGLVTEAVPVKAHITSLSLRDTRCSIVLLWG